MYKISGTGVERQVPIPISIVILELSSVVHFAVVFFFSLVQIVMFIYCHSVYSNT